MSAVWTSDQLPSLGAGSGYDQGLPQVNEENTTRVEIQPPSPKSISSKTSDTVNIEQQQFKVFVLHYLCICYFKPALFPTLAHCMVYVAYVIYILSSRPMRKQDQQFVAYA